MSLTTESIVVILACVGVALFAYVHWRYKQRSLENLNKFVQGALERNLQDRLSVRKWIEARTLVAKMFEGHNVVKHEKDPTDIEIDGIWLALSTRGVWVQMDGYRILIEDMCNLHSYVLAAIAERNHRPDNF